MEHPALIVLDPVKLVLILLQIVLHAGIQLINYHLHLVNAKIIITI
jgi:hypothetical protein